MNRKRPVILVVLAIYIFLPSFIAWVTFPDTTWYKPFVIWLIVIIGTFIIQTRKNNNDV